MLLGLRLPAPVRGRRRALLKLWHLKGAQLSGQPAVAPLSEVAASGTGELEVTGLAIRKGYCVAATCGHHIEAFSTTTGLVRMWRLCAQAELLVLPEGHDQLLTTSKCPAVQTAWDLATGATLDVRQFPSVGARMKAFASSSNGRLLAATVHKREPGIKSDFPQLWVSCMDTLEPEVRCAVQESPSQLHILGELMAGVIDHGAFARVWIIRTGSKAIDLHMAGSSLAGVVLVQENFSDSAYGKL